MGDSWVQWNSSFSFLRKLRTDFHSGSRQHLHPTVASDNVWRCFGLADRTGRCVVRGQRMPRVTHGSARQWTLSTAHPGVRPYTTTLAWEPRSQKWGQKNTQQKIRQKVANTCFECRATITEPFLASSFLHSTYTKNQEWLHQKELPTLSQISDSSFKYAVQLAIPKIRLQINLSV